MAPITNCIAVHLFTPFAILKVHDLDSIDHFNQMVKIVYRGFI